MTSFTPSRGDAALNKSGLDPVLYSFVTHQDLMFGHSDVPLFVSSQTVLMGFSRLLPALAHGDLFIHRVLLHVLHLLLTPLSNQDGIQPSSFGNVPVLSLSNRLQLLQNLSTFPPTAPLQYLGGQVKKGLTCVPLAMCIVEDAWPASPTCCRRPSQISQSRLSPRLEPSTFLAICGLFVRKLTRSPSRLSLAFPSAWKTSGLHSKRVRMKYDSR